MDPVLELLGEAKVKTDAIEEVEIIEEDLAEPSRLAISFLFHEFNLDGVWISPKGFEQFRTMRRAIWPVMDEMMKGIEQML